MKPFLTHYVEVSSFVTKDGSVIRELMHPSTHACQAQSLAEAIVPVGGRTLLHRHHLAEEIYFIAAGQGRMRLGEAEFDIRSGDTVCIAPGVAHAVTNTGEVPLTILCSCSPAYAHEDTVLLE